MLPDPARPASRPFTVPNAPACDTDCASPPRAAAAAAAAAAADGAAAAGAGAAAGAAAAAAACKLHFAAQLLNHCRHGRVGCRHLATFV